MARKGRPIPCTEVEIVDGKPFVWFWTPGYTVTGIEASKIREVLMGEASRAKFDQWVLGCLERDKPDV